MVTAAVFAIVVVAAEVVLYTFEAQTPAIFIAGSVLIVLLAFAALRPVFGAIGTERARAEHLATLGRLSQQMAHDLKNPLAAISGGAEFLLEERRQGRSMDDSEEFVELILEQTKRIEGVIEEYRRLARVEPAMGPVSLGELVQAVVDAQSVATRDRELSLSADIARGIGEIEADRELLATALENLVRNAAEAMEEGERGSAISIEARRNDSVVSLAVKDDGPGMDARTRERALSDFFTTKAEGSGLGLPFARRVAEAHGGELRLASRPGEGTTVTLLVPIT